MKKVVEIGDRRELFVDGLMAERLEGGARLQMQRPVAREVVLRTDQPWEGNTSGYISMFRDGDKIRLYYKAMGVGVVSGDKKSAEGDGLRWLHPYYNAMVESSDGIDFTRPEFTHIPYEPWHGVVTDHPVPNNIVIKPDADKGFYIHGFSVFLDENPAAPAAERYKALGSKNSTDLTITGLFAFTSADGINWSVRREPILRGMMFDSQNLAFWDSVSGCYRAYMRGWYGEWGRYISTSTSPDFVNWTNPEPIELPGVTPCQLYTNQVMPYHRAPHILLGFPTRYIERKWCRATELLPDLESRRKRYNIMPRYGEAITEGLMMAGRGGTKFKLWEEAFLRPGPLLSGSWNYGDKYQGWGMIETPSALGDAPPELSFYAVENYYLDHPATFRRYTLRLDGFMSVTAPVAGGEVVTPPLVFDGDGLELNVETSAAGSVRVQLESVDGKPLPGYSLADCHEIFGDRVDYPVAWQGRDGCGSLAGQVVRLRFKMHDADLYSFKFS